MEEEDRVALDGVMACFYSCCDIIREEDQRTISMSVVGGRFTKVAYLRTTMEFS